MGLASVIETDVPSTSLIGRDVVEAAFFRDSYQAVMRDADADMVSVYAAIFGHSPLPFKLILVARNVVAHLCGLQTPSVDEILNPRIQGPYTAGDKIGPWPIFAISDDEIVAGRDNSHMDFRLSVLRSRNGPQVSVTVSTVCTTHNRFGRAYMTLIEPFHRAGVKALIARALAARRL